MEELRKTTTATTVEITKSFIAFRMMSSHIRLYRDIYCSSISIDSRI